MKDEVEVGHRLACVEKVPHPPLAHIFPLLVFPPSLCRQRNTPWQYRPILVVVWTRPNRLFHEGLRGCHIRGGRTREDEVRPCGPNSPVSW